MLNCPKCSTPLKLSIDTGTGFHDVDQFYKDDAPAPSHAPEKILDWVDGDEFALYNTTLCQLRGDKARAIWELELQIWMERGDTKYDTITLGEGEKLAASKGFTVHRTAKVEPTRAVEVDKFGREIVERLGGAFIVKCEREMLNISRDDGFWCDSTGAWNPEMCPVNGVRIDMKEARRRLHIAAKSLELPTANPAASAKGDDGDIDAMRIAWNGVNTTTSYREDFLFGELLKLKREVAALKAVK